jgi:hypothetical protein
LPLRDLYRYTRDYLTERRRTDYGQDTTDGQAMRRLIGWLLTLIIILPLLTAATLWFAGPSLFAPVEDFPQGPGGAIAYISLYKQLQPQLGKLLTGKDLTLTMTPAEANGMLASALLAGRRPGAPIEKVRSSLGENVITVDLILQFEKQAVPERFRGPIGLRLELVPVMTPDGRLAGQVRSVKLGRVPVPLALVRWAGTNFSLATPEFDPAGPTLYVPVSALVSHELGRPLTIKTIQVSDRGLTLTVSNPLRP